MSLDVGTLVGYLKLDVSDVGKQVRKAQDDVRRGLGDLDKDAEKAGAKVGGTFSASLSKGLKTAGAVLGGLFVVDKVVAWFRGAIDAASDANETINKSTVIFGKNQAAMQEWAKGAVRNLGMTSAGALDAASGFGDMFSQLGFGADQAAAMSRQIVQMGADFGSFNNLGTEDVLERIAAGFRGEYDSLQKLIPNISAARVEQEALAMSGKKSAESLTAQEKAAATLAIVSKDGARAMGDFARTSNDTANVQKQTAAAAQELAVKVGNVLLPAYTALVRFGRDQVIPFLSGTVDVIAPLVSGIGALASGFRDLPGPIQGAVVGMLAFILLKDRIVSFGTAVQGGLKTAGSTIQSFGEAMHYAGLASERAGGGIAGFAAGARTFTGSAGLMKSAASGLLGVLGGPWGAAFTGATMLVGHMVASQAEARRAVDDLTEAFKRSSGAIDQNIRDMQYKTLVDSGAVEAAKKVGLALDVLTEAALGQPAAVREAQDALTAYQATATQFGRGIEGGEQNVAWGKITEAIGASNAQLEAGRQRWQDWSEANKTASGATDVTTKSIVNAGDAAKIAASDFESMADRLERLTNQALDARSASRDYEQAVDDLADAVEKNGKTLDVNTEKGRANQAALDQVATSAVKLAKANLENGASIDAVNKQIDTSRAAFIEQAAKMLGSKTAAEQLADQLGITRGTVSSLADEIGKANTKTVKITVDRAYLDAQLASVRAELSSLSGVATVTARLNATALKNELKLLQNGVDTSRQANGSIMQFAGGGFRGAGIYSDGADIVRFAERGTGGEAYIPLASSKRARSTKILAEANRLMGDPLGVTGAATSGVDPAALAGAVRGALHGARLDLGPVSAITDRVWATLDLAQSREAVYS
jgi:hypothetical protein